MQISMEVAVKGAVLKPVRKNKSELVIILVAESFTPGRDFSELLDKNGKVVHVVFSDSENEEVEAYENAG